MPTIDENLKAWDGYYDWDKQGEEWSSAWGGSEAQWSASIFPRIHAFLPTGTILEIASGFGRWTNYLKDYCDRLVGIDLAESCIKACQQRFASDPHLSFYVNDGRSLAMIEDNSIDFVFTFDSLVHAEADVLKEYLRQLSTKLKPNGIGFIHHSNLGAYRQALSQVEKIPAQNREEIVNRKFLEFTHWREPAMTAKLFEEYCDGSGLQCIGQELVNWGIGGLVIDCFSLITPRNSNKARPNQVIENFDFMREADMIARLSALYTTKSFQKNEKKPPKPRKSFLKWLKP